MAPVTNGRVLFNEVPTGYPVPGKTTVYDESQTIDLDSVPLNGGVLVKTLVLSIDPYLRGRMRSPEKKSYNEPFKLGEPLGNYGVGKVLRSEDPSVKPGDHLYGFYPFQQYAVFPSAKDHLVLKNEEKIPWSYYVGAAGMPGMTAYFAWKEYAAPQPGDVVFVTTGAGPVGSFVIQLAKLDGLKVVASAGSEDKVQFMKSVGADVAFNYKTTSTAEVLAKEGPINIYWDNVGGETLDAALQAAAKGARFIECGMISQYNSEPAKVNNLMQIVAKELKIFGFIVSSLLPKYRAEFYATVPRWLAEGKLKYLEDAKHGLALAGEAILDVQSGKNHGKSVVIVAEDD